MRNLDWLTLDNRCGRHNAVRGLASGRLSATGSSLPRPSPRQPPQQLRHRRHRLRRHAPQFRQAGAAAFELGLNLFQGQALELVADGIDARHLDDAAARVAIDGAVAQIECRVRPPLCKNNCSRSLNRADCIQEQA
ncbi:MAG: hypothetical protein NDI91_11630 [Sulfuritalea sp.]|nr:hypothetical protein [Sulfuritalea sp.]